MNYVERLENVTVLGAAGKMGSGIVLLTAMEMADLALDPANQSRQFILNAVDVSHKALGGLMSFLQVHATKAAEKKTVMLRKMYEDRADLIENTDVINQYVFDVMSVVRPTINLEPAYESGLVFEAIVENPELKVKLLSQIDGNSSKTPWIFTNTSSIPIRELDKRVELNGRILGFHFYNPPAVQKLVELITTDSTQDELVEFAHTFAKKMRKKIVPSNDFAGFIGNGHFMRDALHGFAEVQRLSGEMPFVNAVYMINKISQEYLIRPMGIFQLVDYVGLDVCQCILRVMNPYVPNEDLGSPLLDSLTEKGVRGGQFADGSQRDGFLKYEKGRPAGVYDPDTEGYLPFSDLQSRCDEKLGSMPNSIMPWKAVLVHPARKDVLDTYFAELKRLDTFGADLARRYGSQSKAIAMKLVSDNVARNENDVNSVLLTGFYHVYGPINEYFA